MDFLGGYSNAQILLAYFISGIGQSGTAGKVERSVDFFLRIIKGIWVIIFQMTQSGRRCDSDFVLIFFLVH